MEIKKLIGAIIGLVALGIGTLYVQSWKKLAPKEGRFSVRMPGITHHEGQTQSTPAGPVALHLWQSQAGGVEYFSGYIDFPMNLAEERDLNEIYNLFRDGALSKINGQVKSEYSVTLGSHYGREITCAGRHEGESRHAVLRLYLVQGVNRFYMLGAACLPEREQAAAKDFTRFFDSFDIQGN